MNRRPVRAVAYCAGLVCLTAALAWARAAEPVPTLDPRHWPRLAPVPAPDAALEARISALLERMTPEQKVGQLVQADIGSITPEELRRYPLGSILNGGNSSPHDDKLAAPSEWLALADRFYAASLEASGELRLPALWGTDAVHGHNNIPGATVFPHNIGLGAAHDPELIRRIGEITALEVRVTGLDWAFSPTVAVARDACWGRTYESYSEDPALVRAYARAMVEGLQGRPGTPQYLDAAHVLATPKHFLGDGGTGGKDQGDNLSSEAQLLALDSVGYQAALAAGAQTVMASYSSWQGQKMHGNYTLLTEVLKGRFGFQGLVLGDWNGHAQLPGCSAVSCPAAYNAGLDVLMAPDGWRELLANTQAEVTRGEIDPARLEDAVRRVLRVKLRAHLDSEGAPSRRPFAGRYRLLGAAAHRAVARRAVRESLVLLKNRNRLLPLKPHQSVLVAGDGADSIAKQSGGWTIDWQGTEPNQDFPHAETIYAGIARCVAAAGGRVQLSPSGEFAVRPDVAIVVFGENPYAEFAGDVATLEYSPADKHDLALLRRLHALDIPVVAVFLSGRPLWVNAELNAADSFIAAWLPGPEGGALADVLFRKPDNTVHYDLRGRLPFAWPASPRPPDAATGEVPLFPLGYGLSYGDDGWVRPLPETP
ncbi:MAG: glycoside hydrolase family 3 protein [Gammaproteobacteria bacterium]|nr:glycoside hydrolase family 3 protein [Gammaproteobacteria bacterium]